MEIAVVVIVLVLAVGGGAAALLAAGVGPRPAGLPDWATGRRSRPSLRPPRAIEVPAATVEPVVTRTPAVAPVEDPPTVALTRLGDELRASLATRDEQLTRLDGRLDALYERLSERLERIGRDVVTRWDEEAARQSSGAGRQDAALERLRADLMARWAEREAGTGAQRLGERRMEVTADLYARLARLEAAVAAVTNPILLPGEPYALPTEFLAEALAWENWKDVGERAFAFAEAYSAQRIYLGDPTRAEVAAFVTSLRGLLTRSIYPNLRPNPTPPQVQALRAALETLAGQMPHLRTCLEAEFRGATETKPTTGA